MGEREALLAAVIADPDDDLPRLVYADWLEERRAGSDVARARLIRLQIELARMSDEDDRRGAYKAESDRLIERHWREWGYGVRDGTASYYKATFHRGFLASMSLVGEDLFDPAVDALLAHEPITSFYIPAIDTFPAVVTRWPHLPRIRELSFGDVGDRDKLKALLRSPRLTGLRSLDGSGLFGEDDVALIATDPRFAGLTNLGLHGNDLPDRAVEMIARSTILSRLTDLDISANRTTSAALQALADSPLADRLTSLELRQYAWRDSALGRRAADLLARFRGLKSVDLRGQRIGDDGAAVLARSPLLSSLRTLRLSENALSLQGVTELLSSAHLTGLEVLVLSDNSPGGEWVHVFANVGPRPLRGLWLERTQLDARAASILATTPALAELRDLSLSGNPIGDEGAFALAWSTMLPRLRKLKLGSCEIGDEGATALADSSELSRLEVPGGLAVAGNRYGPKAARRLIERFGYDPGAPDR